MSHDNPHDRAADAVHEGRPVEAQYVRGGRGGVRILLVLLGGLLLVVIAYALIFGFSAKPLGDVDAKSGEPASNAAVYDQTETSQPPAADAPTTATGQPTSPPTREAPNVNAPRVPAQ